MNLASQNYQKYSKLNRCFVYKNVHKIPFTIEKLTLFYTIQKNISLKSLSKLATILELATDQRAYFIRSTQSSTYLKVRKGNPVGVKITLRKKNLNFFLLKLVWEIFPYINLQSKKSNFSKIKDSQINSLTFVISDPLIFSELKSFFFLKKNCPNLRILISFSKKSKKNELYFMSRFCQFPIN
jgi:ribosomal protein L5